MQMEIKITSFPQTAGLIVCQMVCETFLSLSIEFCSLGAGHARNFIYFSVNILDMQLP